MEEKKIDKFFEREEGHILFIGLLLSLSLILFIIVCYQLDPNLATKTTGIVFSNVFVGRVASLSFGYASGLSHFIVIGLNIVIELIMVSILYPLFVLSFKGILKIKTLENFFTEVKEKKTQHQKKFDRYGKVGLFVFVFIPFWMTGPIVGAIIGFLIGIKHYTVISIVFIATCIAITLWGFFLQSLVDFMIILDPRLVWIVLFTLIIGVLFFRFLRNH